MEPQIEIPRCQSGLKHRVQHEQADSRLVAEATHPATARIEIRVRADACLEGSELAIEPADEIAVEPVASRAAEVLDPRMFVWRHCLRSELTANPSRLFSQHNAVAERTRRQRRSHAARPTAND